MRYQASKHDAQKVMKIGGGVGGTTVALGAISTVTCIALSAPITVPIAICSVAAVGAVAGIGFVIYGGYKWLSAHIDSTKQKEKND